MNPEIQQPLAAPQVPNRSVSWKPVDNWVGVGLLALIQVALLGLAYFSPRRTLFQSLVVVLLEAAFILPVVVILAWRHVSWKEIGFGPFKLDTLGLGCGLLVATYSLLAVYGSILNAFHIKTQGEEMVTLFAQLDSPIWIIIAGTVAAPFVEEVFFRGFLFQGFRQRYGWIKAMLLSSLIFAIAHLDPVAFVPIFLLGTLLAYVYHRSNSVWPGIILHFLVNAFGFCGAYFLAHSSDLMPR